MLSDFLRARFCLDFDDSEGTRTIRRGREFLSFSLSIRLTFRYRLALPRCGVARDHWLYHSSRTVVRKRVASGLVNVAPSPPPPPLPPCAHFGPADCYGPECPLINETIQPPRRPVADGSLIPRYRQTFLRSSSSSFDRWTDDFRFSVFQVVCESFSIVVQTASFEIIFYSSTTGDTVNNWS